MSSQNSITIRFIPKGDKELRLAIENLAKAQAKLESRTKEVKKEFKQLGINSVVTTKFLRNMKKEGDTLSRSFATLRSRLLLFSFAMSLGGRQLINFASQAAKLDQMETAFTSLQGGTEGANIALEKLREATNGTMSDFDLFQQANNAMVLGITKNSDEMGELFDKAQRLGAALGVDTVRSIESLVTGLGRQSKLMLDNIGITVDTNKAYEVYANELGKTTKELTDAEKKQAFFNATIKAADKALAPMGEETLTFAQRLERLDASFTNLSTRIGNVLLPLVASLADAFVVFMDLLDEERILAYSIALGTLAAAFVGAKIAAIGFSTALTAVKVKMASTLILLPVILLGEGITALARAMGLFDEENIKAENSTNAVTEAIKAQREEAEKATKKRLDFLNSIADEIALEKKKVELSDREFFIFQRKQKLLKEGHKEEEISEIIIGNLFDQIEKRKEHEKAIRDEQKAQTEMNRLLVGQVNQISTAFVQAAMAGQSMGRAIENAIKGIIAQLAAARITKGILSLPIFSTLGLASSLPNIPSFLGGILGFHNGGMVPAYHGGGSAGNVPAILQEGEFVMRRSAVESIGQENLNRMNRTGTGAVNVTFTGNVMSQDFIESEAIPAIKKAVRRGADLGIS